MCNSKIVDARLLRDKVKLFEISKDKPSYYKW